MVLYCWLGLLTCKTVSHITYTVLMETLNTGQSIVHVAGSDDVCSCWRRRTWRQLCAENRWCSDTRAQRSSVAAAINGRWRWARITAASIAWTSNTTRDCRTGQQTDLLVFRPDQTQRSEAAEQSSRRGRYVCPQWDVALGCLLSPRQYTRCPWESDAACGKCLDSVQLQPVAARP